MDDHVQNAASNTSLNTSIFNRNHFVVDEQAGGDVTGSRFFGLLYSLELEN